MSHCSSINRHETRFLRQGFFQTELVSCFNKRAPKSSSLLRFGARYTSNTCTQRIAWRAMLGPDPLRPLAKRPRWGHVMTGRALQSQKRARHVALVYAFARPLLVLMADRFLEIDGNVDLDAEHVHRPSSSRAFSFSLVD